MEWRLVPGTGFDPATPRSLILKIMSLTLSNLRYTVSHEKVLPFAILAGALTRLSSRDDTIFPMAIQIATPALRPPATFILKISLIRVFSFGASFRSCGNISLQRSLKIRTKDNTHYKLETRLSAVISCHHTVMELSSQLPFPFFY